MRLNKLLAQAGVCSRRNADKMILQGRVKVNGSTVQTLGLKVDFKNDLVQVDGLPIKHPEDLLAIKKIYLAVHKPVGCITTLKDPEGRPTVMDMLPEEWRKFRLFPVGRLDCMSEGLLLMTNDGELANRLIRAAYGAAKVYQVDVKGKVESWMLEKMRQGMKLSDGTQLAPAKVELLTPAHDSEINYIKIILHQGLNRQIRRMCGDLGLKIRRLVRIEQGPIKLGSLPAGKVRELSMQEISSLLKAVGLK